MNRLPGSPRLRASAAIFTITVVYDNRRRSARKEGRLRNARQPGNQTQMAEIRGLEPLFAGRQPAVIAFIPYLLKLFSRRRAPLPEDLDPRRIADRRLSKVGGDAPGTQASPMREHIDELLVRT